MARDTTTIYKADVSDRIKSRIIATQVKLADIEARARDIRATLMALIDVQSDIELCKPAAPSIPADVLNEFNNRK